MGIKYSYSTVLQHILLSSYDLSCCIANCIQGIFVYLHRKINQLNIHHLNMTANTSYERSLSDVLAEVKGND